MSAPRSLADLYWSFTWLALQGFGGVLAVVQREIVERKKWLTPEEFVEDWAVAQILPGPNVVNLSLMIGARHFGVRGAMAALAGMLSLPLLVALALTVLYGQFADLAWVAGALRGMGAVAGGLIIATGLKLLRSLHGNALGAALSVTLGAACFIFVAWLHWPLAWVLLGLGGMAWSLCYWRLRT